MGARLKAILEWCSAYAFGLWILGGLVFGAINLAYGGIFMLGTYVAFLIYESWRGKGPH